MLTYLVKWLPELRPIPCYTLAKGILMLSRKVCRIKEDLADPIKYILYSIIDQHDDNLHVYLIYRNCCYVLKHY